MENKRIVLIGAGNMATALAVALDKAGNAPVAVWSRTPESASTLAGRVGCEWHCSINDMPPADIVIISVVDYAFRDVATGIVSKYPDAIILHTAGSIPMDALREAGASRYGVLYPMQTVNKTNVVPLDDVTVFIEGSEEDVTSSVETLARSISGKVVYATSEQRCILHVAAVFACNFPNALYCMVSELLEKNGLPFDSMLPLIDEAARKVHCLKPIDAQTGPAKRRDHNVMDMHLSMLDDELKDVYAMMSGYIMKRM